MSTLDHLLVVWHIESTHVPVRTRPEVVVFEADIADSIDTIQYCRVEVEPDPNILKSVSSRC